MSMADDVYDTSVMLSDREKQELLDNGSIEFVNFSDEELISNLKI